jgi:hypothetical protein
MYISRCIAKGTYLEKSKQQVLWKRREYQRCWSIRSVTHRLCTRLLNNQLKGIGSKPCQQLCTRPTVVLASIQIGSFSSAWLVPWPSIWSCRLAKKTWSRGCPDERMREEKREWRKRVANSCGVGCTVKSGGGRNATSEQSKTRHEPSSALPSSYFLLPMLVLQLFFLLNVHL